MPRIFLLLTLTASAWSATEGSQRLIKLNVAAVDSKGDPVTDLTASEIQLKEDGKPRTLSFFRFEGSKRPAEQTAPGEFAGHAAPPTIVMLLDRWNERMSTTAAAWTQLTRALQALETGDGVYVYMLTNKGDLLPVRGLPAQNAAGVPQVSPAQLSAELDDAVKKTQGFRSVDEENGILRFNTTAQALASLGQQMSLISGRKSLVWITHGMPLTVPLTGHEWKDFTPQLRLMGAAEALSQIVMYTVDQSAAGAGATPDTSRQTLEMLASETGGRWFPSDSTDRAIAIAMADARGNYTVAYRSPVAEKDKKLHKIHLESTRKGVHLLTREGFYGDTPEPQTEALEQAMIGEARSNPFDASEIGVRVAVTTDAAAKTASLRIRIDPADVLLETENQHHVGHLSLVLASYANTLNGSSRPAPADLNLTDEQFQQAQKDGLVITQPIGISEKTQRVRVIVFDRQLHSVGSATVPVAAP